MIHALALLLAASAMGGGSVVPFLAEGDVVRVQPCAAAPLIGEWRGASPDSFRIRRDDGTDTACSIRATCSLDVQVSRAGSWMKTGLLFGTTLGVAAGVALAWHESDPEFDVLPFYLGVIGGGGAGLAGGALGALVPRWKRVYPEKGARTPATTTSGQRPAKPRTDGEEARSSGSARSSHSGCNGPSPASPQPVSCSSWEAWPCSRPRPHGCSVRARTSLRADTPTVVGRPASVHSARVNAKQLFLERYEGFAEYPEHLVDGLTEEQQRRSPHPSLNPIAWSLWHTARCEDVGVQRLVMNIPQEFDAGAWPRRLRVPDRHIGTAMTKPEVARLSDAIDLAELDAYRRAVRRRTEDAVRVVSDADLDRKLTMETLRPVFEDEGAGGRAAGSLVEAYTGRTHGWILGHLALTHGYYHIGQAFGVRALWGVKNPW